jgi:hypothetical protein
VRLPYLPPPAITQVARQRRAWVEAEAVGVVLRPLRILESLGLREEEAKG